MYVQCNIEARPRNHCQRGKARSVTYCVLGKVKVKVLLITGHEGPEGE